MFSKNFGNYENRKGYKSLAFFKQAEIICDFTMEFCAKYIDYKSRTKDQMEQAARSGKQNISEGYAQREWKAKDKLLRVSRGSFEELLQDYQDFLRQKGLALWGKDDPRAKEARNLVYKLKEFSDSDNHHNNYKDYDNYNSNNSYENKNDYRGYNLYKIYLNEPEKAANAMICLINQTNMMINRKILWLEENTAKEDVSSPREKWLGRKMQEAREKEKSFGKEIREQMRKEGKIFTSRGYLDIEEAKRKGLEEI